MSTPAKGSNTRRSAPGNSLVDSRASLKEDIGAAVPLLGIQRFIQLVLPPLHPELRLRFGHIMARLSNPQSGSYDAVNRWWKAFPKSRSTSENKHFANLAVVAKSVTDAVDHVFHQLDPPHQLMVFLNSPDESPTSDWRSTRHRPDGCFVLRERQKPGEKKPHWMDMGPTGEYKLRGGDGDIRDNTSKVLWNMYHSMRDDPRRRFVFAFSIEKEQMRLWSANRAEVLVSSTFNFMRSPELLVQFFLAFLYGTPEAVGWDPTMMYIKKSDPPQYCITVNDAHGEKQVYKTLGLESSVGAEVLRGRGTRVWRAVRCDPKTFRVSKQATEVALKDCWVDQSRELEGDVIQKLDKLAAKRIAFLKKQLDDLRNAATTPQATVQALEQELDAAEALKASLLIPVIHGVVTLPESNVKDSTLNRDTILKDENGNNVFWEYIFREEVIITGDGSLDELQNQLRGEHRSTYEYLARHRERILYDSKYHYRLVYGEICTSLYQVKSLHSILLHLSNVTRALRGLHEAGWVHRDISAGNILVTGLGVAKLADWEYAKRYVGDRTAVVHDIRTGTIDFMSVEVDKGEYLFIPNLDPLVTPLEKVATPLPPWSYNPLHDMESVLWLAKFFIENKDVIFISKGRVLDRESLATLGISQDASEDDRRKRLAVQRNRVEDLFHGTGGRSDEMHVRRAATQPLHPALVKNDLPLSLEKLRLFLVRFYGMAEQGFVDNPSSTFVLDARIYGVFGSELDTMAASIERIPACVHVVSLAESIAKLAGLDSPIPVDQPNYRREQASPSESSTNGAGADLDHPPVEEGTTIITANLQSITLDPSPASLLRPTSPKEPRPQSSTAASRPPSRTASRAPSRAPSRTGLRSQSRAASRPPSRAAPRPPSRTGLRSQSRATANTPSELRHGSPSDSRPELPSASRPGSRAGLRSASRAQARTGDTNASAANAPAGSKAKQGTPRSTSPGISSKGKGKGRATSPIPPVPSSSRTKPPATQGSAGANKSTAERPFWR